MGDDKRFEDMKNKSAEGETKSSSAKNPETGSQQPKEVQIDPVRLRMFQQQIKDNQNFSMGLLAGFIAASAGAILWGLITYITNYQIGFLALGVGFLVGIAVRKFGAGVEIKFGIAGAILALYGCAAGNIFFVCLAISKEFGVPLSEILAQLNLETMWEFLKAGFEVIDILFYGLAVYFGYRYSFRQITQDELKKLVVQ